MVEQSVIITISVLIGWIIGYMIGHWRCRTEYAKMYRYLLNFVNKDGSGRQKDSEIHVVMQRGKSHGPHTTRTENKD